jgi:uncharacterized protein
LEYAGFRLVRGSKWRIMTYMQDRILANLLKKLESHILLLGPRQVGKSTLVRTLAPGLAVNLAIEADFLAYSKAPKRLLNEVRALPVATLIAIDEVQRVPALLNTVQALIDDNPLGHRFILTGSSARKLKRGGANLLPGRVINLSLCPLLVEELNSTASSAWDLERALQVGMLPGIFLNAHEGSLLLGAYAETYLKEEILAEGLAKDIGAFSRLLDAIAIISGQWLNYSKLASDCEIPKETVRRFVEILEDTLLLHRLPSFRPRHFLSRRVSQRERVLLFDVGVRNALLGLHRVSLPPTERGGLFEQWFILQVIGLVKTAQKAWTLSSYRTVDGAEVDLVVETSRSIIGIEVKAGANTHQQRYAGLLSLEQSLDGYKPCIKVVVYTGERAQLLGDGTRIVPYLEYLEELSALDE